MNESRKEMLSYLEKVNLVIISVFFVIFPLFFLQSTTDTFVLPKQILLSAAIALIILIFGIKTIAEGKLKLRSSPFDVAVVLFAFTLFLSALWSANRYDSFVAFVPVLFLAFLYFGIINTIKTEKQLLFLLGGLVTGSVLAAILAIFSFLKIYLLPFPLTHVPQFNTFGSLLDQGIYFALVLPITGYFAYSYITALTSSHKRRSPFHSFEHKKEDTGSALPIFFTISFVFIGVSLGLTIYQLLTSQKPLILPFEIGMQTGFAAISQDTGNMLKSFLLGSGFGTYMVDFTRFKPAMYNANQTMWAFTFFRSSTFFLELLATTGVVGIATFLYLLYKIVKEKNYFLPLILAAIAAFLLPFSFTILALFFFFLAIFAVVRIHNNPERFSEMELYVVALKRGLFRMQSPAERATEKERRYSRFLPTLFFIFLLCITGIPIYLTGRYVMSDMTFQKSLIAASQNKGLDTYNLQSQAINTFPYRDIYYRVFSQTNLALANAIASNQQKGASPSAETQQQIVKLIQQSITSGRSAVTVAPLNIFNWSNLSSIYRSLIGFGQNADRFATVTMEQAIALDPNNPQQYVDLGGIYYQLGQYDEAIRQFQTAIRLKNDYANAYYNLGHALEAKGDAQSALTAYNTVKTLVSSDQANAKKMSDEIAALTQKINQKEEKPKPASPSAEITPPAEETDQQLDVNKPVTALPEANPKVKIPGPTVSPEKQTAENDKYQQAKTPTPVPSK